MATKKLSVILLLISLAACACTAMANLNPSHHPHHEKEDEVTYSVARDAVKLSIVETRAAGTFLRVFSSLDSVRDNEAAEPGSCLRRLGHGVRDIRRDLVHLRSRAGEPGACDPKELRSKMTRLLDAGDMCDAALDDIPEEMRIMLGRRLTDVATTVEAALHLVGQFGAGGRRHSGNPNKKRTN